MTCRGEKNMANLAALNDPFLRFVLVVSPLLTGEAGLKFLKLAKEKGLDRHV